MNDTPPPGGLALCEASIDRDESFPADKYGLAHPYWDEIGRVWTIGTGLTRLNGQPVTASTPPITRAQNDAAVGFELTATTSLIATIVHVALSACEWAALANWMYNVGRTAATSSTLIRNLNAGNRTAACQEFADYNKSHGRVIPGLVNRRIRTMALFSGADVPGVTDQPGMPSAADRTAIPGGSVVIPINPTLHAGSNTVAKPLPIIKPGNIQSHSSSSQPTADALDDQYN